MYYVIYYELYYNRYNIGIGTFLTFKMTKMFKQMNVNKIQCKEKMQFYYSTFQQT